MDLPMEVFLEILYALGIGVLFGLERSIQSSATIEKGILFVKR